MSIRKMAFAAACAALAAGFSPVASAQEIYVPLMTYRTGPFAGSGTPIANGMADYLTLLNERDGGIGGMRLNIEECETGYDTKKGVECYDSMKAKNPVVHNPYSTGITLALIPKASVDKVPILSMAYGLSAAAVGSKFPWIFNPPATYWDGLSIIIKYIGQQEGGIEKLKGKKIGFIFLDAGYGREPIPLLEQFGKSMGFEVKLYPVPAQSMQNQSAQWLAVRRDRPDYMIMWGWGAMNPTAVKEAARSGYPMDKFIGTWWSAGEDDARGGGDDAKGYKALNFNGVGTGFPVLAEIQKYVIEKGKSKTEKDKFGEALYNRGVLNSLLIAEAIRNAQRITGKKQINAEDFRRGMETLNITPERLRELGMEGFANPVKLTCDDHSGHHAAFIQQWDGKKWNKISDWIEPMKTEVRAALIAAADEHVAKNQPWPARTEPCDAK